MDIELKAHTANSTFAIGGVSCSADSFVVKESAVPRMNIYAEKPAHRKSAKRYASPMAASQLQTFGILIDKRFYETTN